MDVLVEEALRRALVAGGCPICRLGERGAAMLNQAQLRVVEIGLRRIEIDLAGIEQLVRWTYDGVLARLEWELEEALRKSGWEYRPEAPGAEATAWRRALLTFSGSLTDGA